MTISPARCPPIVRTLSSAGARFVGLLFTECQLRVRNHKTAYRKVHWKTIATLLHTWIRQITKKN